MTVHFENQVKVPGQENGENGFKLKNRNQMFDRSIYDHFLRSSTSMIVGFRIHKSCMNLYHMILYDFDRTSLTSFSVELFLEKMETIANLSLDCLDHSQTII